MAFKITFTDNSLKIIGNLDKLTLIALEESAGEIESAVKRNTKVGKVNGGKTRGAWRHWVDAKAYTGYVGNPLETSLWKEFGTGEYALEGNGRKGGWYIPIGTGRNQISEATVEAYGFRVVYGKNGKKFAYTTGMKPDRPLQKAFNSNKRKVINHIQDTLKGL